MNCDPIANSYRWLEYAAFGRLLERARFHWLGKLISARRILVLGDGDGRFVARLVEANPSAEIDCLDLSRRMLRLTAKRLARLGLDGNSRVTLRQADASTEPPPHQGYDLLVTHFFLDCFDESELARLAEHLAPSLATNGRWLVTDFRIPVGRPVAPLFGLAAWIMYRFFRYTTGLEVSRLADFPIVLAGAGFECVDRASLAGGFVFSEIWRRVPQRSGCVCTAEPRH